MSNKVGSSSAEQSYVISETVPGASEATLGLYWIKGSTGQIYVCTNTSPIVFTEKATAAAPDSADYLVGTANGSLSNEIVVGTAPGGELGGTWASPTVDATHSGSAHHTQSHDHSAAGDGQALLPTTLTLPNGAGGTTVDATGEICVDSTSKTINFYDGAAERVLNPIQSKAFMIETPVATDDLPIWATDVAITLLEVRYLCIGGTNWVGQLQECDANGINGADVSAADTTATAGTVQDVTTFSNAAIDAGDWVGIKTTSISGTPTSLHVTFYYVENP